MSDPLDVPDMALPERSASLFSTPQGEPPRRGFLYGIAGVVLVLAIVVSLLVLRGRKTAPPSLNSTLPPAPYAASLSFTELTMSQSTSLSGGTSTYIDGHVRNSGLQTVTAVTMQVLFRNDEGLSPRVESLPLSLIRTHEPYVDTEPVNAAPLKSGDQREFRLIFEAIPANWNQQLPQMQAIAISLK